jgi:hypothetical protein
MIHNCCLCVYVHVCHIVLMKISTFLINVTMIDLWKKLINERMNIYIYIYIYIFMYMPE